MSLRVEDIRARLMGAPNPGERSDFDLNPHTEASHGHDRYRPAAVLVPIIDRDNPAILLTKRSEKLPKHAGQVSFPGGRIDPGDVDAEAAALRETHEEVGIAAQHVEVIGTLDTYRTGTGFEISPFVGVVAPPLRLRPEPGEVDAIFEVPLEFILDRRNHRKESAVWRGLRRHYYAMPYQGYNIWGATAAMLVNLCDLLDPD